MTNESKMDALIYGTDRVSHHPHGLAAAESEMSFAPEMSAFEMKAGAAMVDALGDILKEEARRDAARRG